jgi:hypothetical protein
MVWGLIDFKSAAVPQELDPFADIGFFEWIKGCHWPGLAFAFAVVAFALDVLIVSRSSAFTIFTGFVWEVLEIGGPFLFKGFGVARVEFVLEDLGQD